MRWILLAPYLVVTAVHLASDIAGPTALADATQVLLMPALALFFLAAAPRRTRLAVLTG